MSQGKISNLSTKNSSYYYETNGKRFDTLLFFVEFFSFLNWHHRYLTWFSRNTDRKLPQPQPMKWWGKCKCIESYNKLNNINGKWVEKSSVWVVFISNRVSNPKKYLRNRRKLQIYTVSVCTCFVVYPANLSLFWPIIKRVKINNPSTKKSNKNKMHFCMVSSPFDHIIKHHHKSTYSCIHHQTKTKS